MRRLTRTSASHECLPFDRRRKRQRKNKEYESGIGVKGHALSGPGSTEQIRQAIHAPAALTTTANALALLAKRDQDNQLLEEKRLYAEKKIAEEAYNRGKRDRNLEIYGKTPKMIRGPIGEEITIPLDLQDNLNHVGRHIQRIRSALEETEYRAQLANLEKALISAKQNREKAERALEEISNVVKKAEEDARDETFQKQLQEHIKVGGKRPNTPALHEVMRLLGDQKERKGNLSKESYASRIWEAAKNKPLEEIKAIENNWIQRYLIPQLQAQKRKQEELKEGMTQLEAARQALLQAEEEYKQANDTLDRFLRGEDLQPEVESPVPALEEEAKEEEQVHPVKEEGPQEEVQGAGKRMGERVHRRASHASVRPSACRSTPLSDDDIDMIMAGIPNYLGTICRDELPKLTPAITDAWSRGSTFGWIMLNLTRSQAEGTDHRPSETGHWVAIAVDPDKKSLMYYNSYAEPAPKDIRAGLKAIFDLIAPDELIKFKENGIVEQRADTNNCGWFCIRFLLDTFAGAPFTEATGFDSAKGEAEIEEFKKKFPNHKVGELSKEIGEAFKALSAEEKKEWEDKAAAAKEQYEKELKEYIEKYGEPPKSERKKKKKGDDDEKSGKKVKKDTSKKSTKKSEKKEEGSKKKVANTTKAKKEK